MQYKNKINKKLWLLLEGPARRTDSLAGGSGRIERTM